MPPDTELTLQDLKGQRVVSPISLISPISGGKRERKDVFWEGDFPARIFIGISGLMQLYAGTILMSLMCCIAENFYHCGLRLKRPQNRRKGSPITADSTPLVSTEYAHDCLEHFQQGLPYHRVASDSTVKARQDRALCRRGDLDRKRVLLLCDKDGNALDLVYL